MDKFSKMRHKFSKMLQIMVPLKIDHLVEENKNTEYFQWPCSSREDQILTIWHFPATTTPNSDLNINNNMANKKMTKN